MTRMRLDDFPPAVQMRIKEALDAQNHRSGQAHAEPQQAGALVAKVPREEVLDADAPRLRVAITRRAPRELDDDNFIGGCKQLRVAFPPEQLGDGVAERDGLCFEYAQERGAASTIIEISEIKEN